MKVKLKTNILWHILFFDVLFLSLRLGGLTVLDLTIHAGLLILASAFLLAHQRLVEIPRIFYLIFIPVLVIALIQLIPLPQGLFASLAPIKWRTGQIAQQLFPQIHFSTQITMMPGLHLFKMASFALDIFALAVMLMAPRPSSNTLRFWLFSLALILGSLATMSANGGIDASSPISFYEGTIGALINPNDFAAFAVMLLMPLIAQTLVLSRRALNTYRDVKPVPIDVVTRKLVAAGALLGAIIILFAGFHQAYSRSGVIDFMIALIGFSLTLILTYRGKYRALVRFSLIPIILFALVIVPGQAALQKFEDRGLQSIHRLNALHSAVELLSEKPFLGAGMGSTEGILNQTFPQPPYRVNIMADFHNDFIQTLFEFGPVGLICLLIFLYWCLREAFTNLSERSFEPKAMAACLVGLTLMLCFASSVSFPLRVTSIRMLALLLLAICIKLSDMPRRMPRAYFWRFSPLPLVGLAIFAWMLPKALEAENAESYMEERELRFGNFAQASLLSASRELEDIFNYNPPISFTAERLPLIRAYVLEHLEGQVFSVQGLTLMFMLEIIEERIAHPGEKDPEVFARFKVKAKIIGDLGQNRNAHATGPWMFFYATYRDQLGPEDTAAFDKIRSEWFHYYYPRQLRAFPESKGDYVLPKDYKPKPK